MTKRALPALGSWSVRAINLPEHSDNIIHVDEGARAAGFPSALVAGTTIFAYLTHVPAAAWGRSWIDDGGCEVRLKAPVFADDLVDCVATDELVVEAKVADSIRCTLEVWPAASDPGPHVGDPLPPMTFDLGEQVGGYGMRAGDDLAVYAEDQIVHPAAWPVIGNRVTIPNFITGPWIHVRSKVQHLGRATFGSSAVANATVLDRFESRAGERVILDIRVSIDGRPVASIEHESIIKLAD